MLGLFTGAVAALPDWIGQRCLSWATTQLRQHSVNQLGSCSSRLVFSFFPWQMQITLFLYPSFLLLAPSWPEKSLFTFMHCFFKLPVNISWICRATATKMTDEAVHVLSFEPPPKHLKFKIWQKTNSIIVIYHIVTQSSVIVCYYEVGIVFYL